MSTLNLQSIIKQDPPNRVIICDICEKPANIFVGATPCCGPTAGFKWAYWIDGELIPVEEVDTGAMRGG